jgi:quinol monooxygenase YgiN
MIIVAGHLTVAAHERETYLACVHGVNALARGSKGCLDFVQAADPIEGDRIVIFERWEDDAALLAFRSSGDPADEPQVTPRILSAEVRKYRIAGIESP